MSISKKIKKFMASPSEMRIGEIIAVLAHFGYIHIRTNGSHYIFDKSGRDTIVIPVHNGKVGRYYLKYIKSVIVNQ